MGPVPGTQAAGRARAEQCSLRGRTEGGQGHTGPNFQPALLLAWEGEVRGVGQQLALEWRKPLEGEVVQRLFSGRFAASADELFPWGLWLLPAFHPQNRAGVPRLHNPKQRFLLPTHIRGKLSAVSASRCGPGTRLSGKHQEDWGPVCSSSRCRGQPQVTQGWAPMGLRTSCPSHSGH